MVVLREPPVLRQLPIKVYESDIKIQNFCSSEIAQVSLWSSQNPRLSSHFASKPHVDWILSLKKFDWSESLFTFFRVHGACGNMALTIQIGG